MDKIAFEIASTYFKGRMEGKELDEIEKLIYDHYAATIERPTSEVLRESLPVLQLTPDCTLLDLLVMRDVLYCTLCSKGIYPDPSAQLSAFDEQNRKQALELFTQKLFLLLERSKSVGIRLPSRLQEMSDLRESIPRDNVSFTSLSRGES